MPAGGAKQGVSCSPGSCRLVLLSLGPLWPACCSACVLFPSDEFCASCQPLGPGPALPGKGAGGRLGAGLPTASWSSGLLALLRALIGASGLSSSLPQPPGHPNCSECRVSHVFFSLVWWLGGQALGVEALLASSLDSPGSLLPKSRPSWHFPQRPRPPLRGGWDEQQPNWGPGGPGEGHPDVAGGPRGWCPRPPLPGTAHMLLKV